MLREGWADKSEVQRLGIIIHRFWKFASKFASKIASAPDTNRR